MKHPDLLTLLRRYQQGECTPEEKRVVENWYALLGEQQPPLTLSPAEREQLRASLWQRVENQLAAEDEDAASMGPARPWYAGRWPWAAAAALAVGLGVAGGKKLLTAPAAGPSIVAGPGRQASGWHSYHNTTRQYRRIRLADGSTVEVSPGGQLKYPRQFADRHRTVYLQGEAFFTIAHDKAHPFRVYTNQVVTTVLGTSFLVRAPAGGAPVVVKVRTGRVQVTPRAVPAAAVRPASLVVLPNQQAVYSPGQQALQRELVAEPLQLAAQSFAFDDRPVAEVLAALETAYGVAIDYDAQALAGCTVTLHLGDESLYGKLDVLCKTLGASYSTVNARILFRSPGCVAH
ncbi:ferric-dicitrate binding protein FerR (iron transport regulator) [Hymenobacter luteus]|uniref:Ferric-dicitrate binding protein FerR (Iron transport regulator) n=2 Tax=Hymenobacter TaxID=89966 RepID=A0A7W9T1T3_9BACT|nr:MULTISPECIES: FecR family protein [Hymenobacter]MBB4601622.1 ferric-dicitrate binding protein FerR (iron transport regulator) [Hymenobacter latericoloratus]MBB6059950.1 ferric-dicitrate binding protein FerR (iron transport regulator) [Hymenobacter luteus]